VAALLGGLILALTVPGTGLKAQVLDISKSVLLSWPEQAEEQIVVGADALTGPVWTPRPEPIFKRFGQMCMTVPTTASEQYFRLVPGTQFADDFSDAWGPFTNRDSWTAWLQEPGEDWVVTNGVLQADYNAPSIPGFALFPLGTNVDAVVCDFFASVDIVDWVTSSNNVSGFSLAGRRNGYAAYFGGLGLNVGGVAGKVTLFLNNGSGVLSRGATNDVQLPYRLQFSGVGSQLVVRLLNATTGQLIDELSATAGGAPPLIKGSTALYIEGWNNPGDSFRLKADNFIMTGTK
jgi:hypothetical protein